MATSNKLVLHFDINGTITLFDSDEPGNKLENVNMVIARSAYGKVLNGKWIPNKNWRDEKDSISYYKYLKKTTPDYKKQSYISTNKGKPLEHLVNYIQKLLKSDFLMDSFIEIIKEYGENPDVIIVLRTFGADTDNTVKNLQKCIRENTKLIIKGTFNHYDDRPVVKLENGHTIHGLDDLNKYFLHIDHYLALQEDYDYWNNKGRTNKYGKQLLGDSKITQIFFDDNNCVNVINDLNTKFVKVNTLDAIDKNYYKNIIRDYY